MKTRNFIPTLLALTIQMMAISQTQGTQSSRRSLQELGKVKTTVTVSNSKTTQKTVFYSDTRKVYPTLVSNQESVAKKSPAPEFNNNVIDNNTFNYNYNTNCYSTLVYAKELIKQADDLSVVEKTLRDDASIKQGAEKAHLLKAATELMKQIELKLIQASEIAGKVNIEKYKMNNIVFNNMMFTSLAGEEINDKAAEINSEAVHTIKMAKEIREEAYSLKSNTAKLGTMNNAEEKETIALNKQNQAIGLLKEYVSYMANRSNDLAVK